MKPYTTILWIPPSSLEDNFIFILIYNAGIHFIWAAPYSSMCPLLCMSYAMQIKILFLDGCVQLVHWWQLLEKPNVFLGVHVRNTGLVYYSQSSKHLFIRLSSGIYSRMSYSVLHWVFRREIAILFTGTLLCVEAKLCFRFFIVKLYGPCTPHLKCVS